MMESLHNPAKRYNIPQQRTTAGDTTTDGLERDEHVMHERRGELRGWGEGHTCNCGHGSWYRCICQTPPCFPPRSSLVR